MYLQLFVQVTNGGALKHRTRRWQTAPLSMCTFPDRRGRFRIRRTGPLTRLNRPILRSPLSRFSRS